MPGVALQPGPLSTFVDVAPTQIPSGQPTMVGLHPAPQHTGSLQYPSAIAFEGRMDLPVEESALPASATPAQVEEPAPKKGKAAAAPPPPAPTQSRVYNRW